MLSPYLHRIGLLTDCVLRPNGMTGAPMKMELSEVVPAFQSTASNLQKQLPSFLPSLSEIPNQNPTEVVRSTTYYATTCSLYLHPICVDRQWARKPDLLILIFVAHRWKDMEGIFIESLFRF